MKRKAVIGLGVMLAALVSCEKKAAAPVPPPPVTFATAEAQDTPYTIDTFGNCATIADVTLQAQVTGTLLKYAVAQGAMVKAGDLIAQIDPAPYQAALQEAQGSLDSAKAQLSNAEVTLQRQQELYKTKTIDLADLQNAEANQLQAQGSVQTAEGQLANAKINLGYCTITSPIEGKTGLYQVDAGNLVTANNTKLVNIQTISPIYVNFTISENDFDRVRQYFVKGGELPVEVTIPGATDGKVITGKLTFINNDIASATGTLTLEATLPNDDARLWPGLYVNVRLVLATLDKAIVVPSPCVMIGQQGPYVFVVNADNTVTQKNITLGQRQADGFTFSLSLSPSWPAVTTRSPAAMPDSMTVRSPWRCPRVMFF